MIGGYMELCKVKKIRITLVENTNNLRLLGKQCVEDKAKNMAYLAW